MSSVRGLIKGYDYWAHTDPDVIWGSLDKVIETYMNSGFDVLSGRGEYWISGPFGFYKNNENVNNLFRLASNYKDVYKTGRTVRFVETSGLWGDMFFGRKITDVSQAVSMTEIVRKESESRRIEFINENVIREFKTIRQWKFGDFRIQFDGGRMSDRAGEIAMFHMVFVKADPLFITPSRLPRSGRFVIDSRGVTPLRADGSGTSWEWVPVRTAKQAAVLPGILARSVSRRVRRGARALARAVRHSPTA